MPHVFHPSTNTISRVSVFGAVFFVLGAAWIAAVVDRSSYVTGAGVARSQPVPFSHKHHAGELGIDCRYCHTSVEEGPFAGIPSSALCMHCHSQIWARSPVLEPVRESFRGGEPLRWVRVHDLPDFVYFDHSIHVHKGIGCVTCHGPVARRNLVSKGASLKMEWCLECHRAPEEFVRPREAIFDPDPQPVGDPGRRRELVRRYGIVKEQLTDCSVCHR
ncbi:MAG: cytochrome c [Candidatus Binatia bacterium]|nr:MAG: cytochrome c [Candidatus Binatia bacterium]